MAGPDDWQPVAKPVDDWQPASAAAPPASFDERFTGEQPEPIGFGARVAGGWRNVWHDTSDFAKEGVQQVISAPGQIAGTSPNEFADVGEQITKRLREAGASEAEAKREGDRLARKLQVGSGFLGPVMGTIEAITSPFFGAYRSFFSRPVEEQYGIPKEATELVGQTVLAIAGLRAGGRPARVRIGADGAVSAQVIGEAPKGNDFAIAAEALGSKDLEPKLRQMWEHDGIHPAEAAQDASRDAFVKQELRRPQEPAEKLPPERWSPDELAENPYELPKSAAGEPLRGLGADVSNAPSLAQQPAPPPGRLSTALATASDTLFDIGRDIQMKLAPMATGTRESMATAKDFANSLRRNRWEWARIDADIEKRFTPEQRARMWNAADEESVARQLGESREHQGLITLTADERAAVQDLQSRAQAAWLKARDLGMVEGEGLPAYTPRMVINTAEAVSGQRLPLNGIGQNLRTKTSQMMRRKHMTVEETEAAAKAALGEGAEVARDIRVLPMATAKLEDAIAGRTLINNIKDIGKQTGLETVAEGAKPSGSDFSWFTIDHPAFRTWRPKFKEEDGKVVAVTDKDGNTIFEQVPLYVRSDFEGPLRAVLTEKSGPVYGALMSLKGKTMGLIMNSPAIHNMVEFGRAFPAMPVRIFKAYFDGNRAKNDPAVMGQAIDTGLVPIGKRFFNQDVTAIMESPNLTPGRSWTAQVLGAVPGLFDEAAGAAVKRAIDKAGDFWHNTLLWDRIADLQMGLYVNFRGDMIAKGIDAQTASRISAHLANRYAGALPQEAMSQGATKVANFLLFSRSFTLGNLGVLKDMFTGLPKDVIAQIERDAGFRAGAIDQAGNLAGPEVQAVSYAKSLARRKAIATVALDVGLAYVGYSLFQNMSNVLLGDSTLGEELHGYVRRMRDLMEDVKVHPWTLLQPFAVAERLSATGENEPGRKDRVKVGYTKDGTAIYARNPVGKIGEEFINWGTSPIDMLKRKEGTIARPLLQVLSNDKGFGRKVYDPTAETPAAYAGNIWQIVKHLAVSQTPEGQISAAADLVRGEGDAKLNALQTFGPVAGFTFSKGAPGGPAVGEVYHARTQHEYAVQMALPDLRKQIQRGDVAGAQQRMTELRIPTGLQAFYIRTSLNPASRLSGRLLRDFYLYSTPEQQQRLERVR